MFIPSQLLREAFIHAAITARRLFVARYSFIQLSELWQRGVNEIAKASKRQQEDTNPGSMVPHKSPQHASRFFVGRLQIFHRGLICRAISSQHTSRYFIATSTPLLANLELSKHGGAHTGDAEKKTEVSFVRLDYATEDKETQKSKQTKSFRLLKSPKNPQLHCQHVLQANLPMCLLKCRYVI